MTMIVLEILDYKTRCHRYILNMNIFEFMPHISCNRIANFPDEIFELTPFKDKTFISLPTLKKYVFISYQLIHFSIQS